MNICNAFVFIYVAYFKPNVENLFFLDFCRNIFFRQIEISVCFKNLKENGTRRKKLIFAINFHLKRMEND